MSKIKRPLFHITFWLLSIFFLAIFIMKGFGGFYEVMPFVLLLMPIAVLTSYSINYFLFPNYLFKEKHFQFFLYLFFVVILSLYLQMMAILLSYIFLAKYNYENMIPGTMNIINLGVGLYFIVFLHIMIFLVKRWTGNQAEEEEKILTFRSNRELVRLNHENILYIESLDNYVQIHSPNQVFITKNKIGELESNLGNGFLRVHRSYLVNLNKINSFSREFVKVDLKKLPISRKYKPNVIKVLEKDHSS